MARLILGILFTLSLVWANTPPVSKQIRTLPDGTRKIVTQSEHPETGDNRRDHTGGRLDQGGEQSCDAAVITTLPFCDTGTTVGYLNDFPEDCAATFSAPDVVYEYSPPIDRAISISLNSSSYATHVALYESDVDCNSYFSYDCASSGGSPQSCIEDVWIYSGYTYYIVVDGEFGESGDYTLHVVPGASCPNSVCGSASGETCETALPVGQIPYCDTRNTNDYADDYFPDCNTLACGEKDVVYEFSPATDMFLGISVASSEFQPHVEIDESGTDCVDRYLYECADVNSGGNSCISGVFVYAGYQYYIFVDGHECGGNGQYTLNIYEGGGCSYDTCSTSNGSGETCADAISVNSLPYHYSGSTAGMTNDYDFCQYDLGAPDIVFSYTPTHTHLADILTCGSTEFESNLYIFRDGDTFAQFGPCGIHACYTFTDNYYSNAAMYCVEFEVGHEYCIVVDGAWSYSEGPFTLDITETSVQSCNSGDLCDYPIVENEPNNSCSPLQFDVDTLFPGDTIAGIICDPCDEDFFYVVANEDEWSLVRIEAGPNCSPGSGDLGISYVNAFYCGVADPCTNCSWVIGCGPEVQGVKVAGLGSCYTGPYLLISEPQPAPQDACDPVACETASPIACGTPVVVNTCDGCSSPICQTYRNGNSGIGGYTGPQKFYRLDVSSAANYTVHVADDAQQSDVQFSIFTDCELPRTTCVYAQDQNYYAEQPTGQIWEETGTVLLNPGTYYLHVSFANSNCGDMNVSVTCDAPCLPPDNVTIHWNTSSEAEIRFISAGGTYEIYSSDIPNNDGDPRGGDPQWTLRSSQVYAAGQALWTDTNVSSDYRNYVVIQNCP